MIYQNAIEKYLQKDNDHNPVIMTSVDEVTFVIKPTEDTVGEYPDNWQQIALSLAETIAEKLSLPALFGEYAPLKTPLRSRQLLLPSGLPDAAYAASWKPCSPDCKIEPVSLKLRLYWTPHIQNRP